MTVRHEWDLKYLDKGDEFIEEWTGRTLRSDIVYDKYECVKCGKKVEIRHKIGEPKDPPVTSLGEDCNEFLVRIIMES